MLSAWENRRPHKERSNGRFYRMKLRVTRWWIYRLGSGDPERNPFMLTSKIKNLPMTSLRNDEYIDFLSKQHFVGKKWEEYWEKTHFYQTQNILQFKYNNRMKTKQLKAKVAGTPSFKIYEDGDSNKENTYVTVRRNKGRQQAYLDRFQIVNDEDICSLDSLENDLIANASTLSEDHQSDAFWLEEEPAVLTKATRLVTPKHQAVLNQEVAKVNEFKNKINIIADSSIINLTMDDVVFKNDCNFPKPVAEKQLKPNTKRTFSEFDKEYVTVRKRNKGFGLKGWIATNVNPLNKDSFNDRISYKGSSLNFQRQKIPLIQQAGFFSRNSITSKDTEMENGKSHYNFPSISQSYQYHAKIYDENKINEAKTISITKAAESLITQTNQKNCQSAFDGTQKETTPNQIKKPSSYWRIFSGLRPYKLTSTRKDFSADNNQSEESKEILSTPQSTVETEARYEENIESLRSVLKQISATNNDVHDMFASYEGFLT